VRRIVSDVRQRGDEAVRYWTETIDRRHLDSFAISPQEWAAALARLPGDLQASLRVAAQRIRAFHARQPIPAWSTTELGGVLGQTVTPLDRVGVYVPGGTAALPSSLLMSALPAQVAGVQEVVVATPPGRSGVPYVILAAAHLAGVQAVYRVGGAQAIAALAFGTQSIPRVDKIVGAGNLFVTLAKQQVFGQVGLDGLAGPTETVVVADDSPICLGRRRPLGSGDAAVWPRLFATPRAHWRSSVAEVARRLNRAGADIICASVGGRGSIVITQTLSFTPG
jgi:histidinol dehydrogenase